MDLQAQRRPILPGEQSDELAPLHSITSLAVARNHISRAKR
jgi:hypothetical protein